MVSNALSAQHSEDIAFAKALHGDQIKTGLLANLASKNAEVHNVATDTYLKMWKESSSETKEDEAKRLDSYTQLVNSYYNLATDFYEYGKNIVVFDICACSGITNEPGTAQVGVAVSTFAVITPVRNSSARLHATNTTWLPILVSSAVWRFWILDVVSVCIPLHWYGRKDRVAYEGLSVCIGGPAREIAEFTGAHVTGLNNNAYQVQRATYYAAKQGLSEQTNFIKVLYKLTCLSITVVKRTGS